MSVTHPDVGRPFETAAQTSSLPRATFVVGLVAAVVTTAAAAVADLAGVSFEIEGEMIPIYGFAQLTLIGAVIGGVLVAALNRWSGSPRARFVQTTVVLTIVSCVPSVAMPDDIATQIALVVLHLLAAAIIVPVLARHARI
jgi:hypothetical protein